MVQALYISHLSHFYFAQEEFGSKIGKSKIALLISPIQVAESNKQGVLLAAQSNAIEDFEDGLEYYAALQAHCSCIITEDVDDFYFSEIEILSAQLFLEKYCIQY